MTTRPPTPADAAESHALNTVTYYDLSEDDKVDAADPVVGRRRVPQLGPTQHHSEVTPVTLEPDVKPGACFSIAVANGGRNIEERYLANNVRAVKVTVRPADPPKEK